MYPRRSGLVLVLDKNVQPDGVVDRRVGAAEGVLAVGHAQRDAVSRPCLEVEHRALPGGDLAGRGVDGEGAGVPGARCVIADRVGQGVAVRVRWGGRVTSVLQPKIGGFGDVLDHEQRNRIAAEHRRGVGRPERLAGRRPGGVARALRVVVEGGRAQAVAGACGRRRVAGGVRIRGLGADQRRAQRHDQHHRDRHRECRRGARRCGAARAQQGGPRTAGCDGATRTRGRIRPRSPGSRHTSERRHLQSLAIGRSLAPSHSITAPLKAAYCRRTNNAEMAPGACLWRASGPRPQLPAESTTAEGELLRK